MVWWTVLEIETYWEVPSDGKMDCSRTEVIPGNDHVRETAHPSPLVMESGNTELDDGILNWEVLYWIPSDGEMYCSMNGVIPGTDPVRKMAHPSPLVMESGTTELDNGILKLEVLYWSPSDGEMDCSRNGVIPGTDPVREMAPTSPLVMESGTTELENGIINLEVLYWSPGEG